MLEETALRILLLRAKLLEIVGRPVSFSSLWMVTEHWCDTELKNVR